MDELAEIMDVVIQLNDKYYHEDFMFNMASDGNVDVIAFNEHVLWHSEDDEREWDDKGNDYAESLFDHCDKKFVSYVELLNQILQEGLKNG